jgi:hypothetical protein
MNFNPGGHPICIDSGASCSISNNKLDFMNLTPTSNPVLHGISSGLTIEGKCTLHWFITNNTGDEIDLYIDSLYVPSTPMCLLSPQQLLQQTNNIDDGFNIQNKYGTLRFSGHTKTIYYNKNNSLPIFFTAPKLTSPSHPDLPSELSSLTTALLNSETLPETTVNLTATQWKLLL